MLFKELKELFTAELILKIYTLSLCYGTEAVATEHIYLRSLQDIIQSIVRVEGVKR